MSNYIRLTIPPGNTDQSANTILINASRDSIPANIDDSFFITPVRQNVPGTQVLYYDTTTKEVTHGAAAPPNAAIWGVWGLDGPAGVAFSAGGTPAAGYFLPSDASVLIPSDPATMQSIKISLSDCTAPVQSPLMGINGALSASGGYHIVIRGWDTDCSGEDVYKMQAKYTINDHRIDTPGVATFDVSYNSSSGVFQGSESPPASKYYNIIIAQDIAPMGPTGMTGATGATGATGPCCTGPTGPTGPTGHIGDPAIAISSVWVEGDGDGSVASDPSGTEFIPVAGSNVTMDPSLITELRISSVDCHNDASGNSKLLMSGYLTGKKLVIRGYNDDCSGTNVEKVQAEYNISGHTAYPAGPNPAVGYLSVTHIDSAGMLGEYKYHKIIIGDDIAPIGPTGPCCTGPTGPKGPTGLPAVGAVGSWFLQTPNGDTAATDPLTNDGEFQPVGGTGTGTVEYDPSLVTRFKINATDCHNYPHTDMATQNLLDGAYLVIRGWDTSCNVADIYKVQAKYRLKSHQVNKLSGDTTACYDVSYIYSNGAFTNNSSQAYYNIILGADIAEIGPTGPCCTGPTGYTGPKGIDGVGAAGVWQKQHTADAGDVSGAFLALDDSLSHVTDPADVSSVVLNIADCHKMNQPHLKTDSNTVGAYFVIRGWSADCSGAEIYRVQATYRIVGHTYPSTHNGTHYDQCQLYLKYESNSGFGTFGVSGYHHIIVGADPAPVGPTGPTGTTGPTGPRGFTGAPAVGAAGVWNYDEAHGAPQSAAGASGGYFYPLEPSGGTPTGYKFGESPSLVTRFEVSPEDCTGLYTAQDISAANTMIGGYLVVRGWDASCVGDEVWDMQAKYRIMSHAVGGSPHYATFDVSFISAAGVFEGDAAGRYYNLILGSDIAPMGPTGPCCTGPTGSRGPTGMIGPIGHTGLSAIAAAGVWLNENVAGAPIGGPGPYSFESADFTGNMTNDPSSVHLFKIYKNDCHSQDYPKLTTPGFLVGDKLVVRGWDDDCSGGNVHKVQSEYQITGHSFSANIADLSVNWVSSQGQFEPSGYHSIIIGADIAPIGPTGPCCTGPTGFTGPTGPLGLGDTGATGPRGFTGAPAVGAAGVWNYDESTPAIHPGGAPHGLFYPLEPSGGTLYRYATNPALVTRFDVSPEDCTGVYTSRDISAAGTMIGGYLVVRGWDASCTGADVWKMHAKYRIMSHTAGGSPHYATFDVSYVESAGVFEGDVAGRYYNLTLGSDIAPMGPTGPCCTGPTGPVGATGATAEPAINAAGVWLQAGVSGDSIALAPGSHEFVAGDSSANSTMNPQLTTIFRMDASDCTPTSHPVLGISGALVGKKLVVRGWDSDCSGTDVYQVQSTHIITSHKVNLGTADLSVNWVSSFGLYEEAKYHNIIIGANVAPVGPTGPSIWSYTTNGIRYPAENELLGNVGIGMDPQAGSQARLSISGEILFNDLIRIDSQTGTNTNTSIGYNVMMANVNGDASKNTAIGHSALKMVSDASHGLNTAVGYEALRLNTGNGNTAVGCYGLRHNSTGNYNTALGRSALHENTQGFENTAIGMQAIRDNTTGNKNTAVGYRALVGNQTGSSNLALGFKALDGAAVEASGCIVLNATGDSFNPPSDASNAFYVKPIAFNANDHLLFYNPADGEITFGSLDAATGNSYFAMNKGNVGGGSGSTQTDDWNFYGPSSESMPATGQQGGGGNTVIGVDTMTLNTTGEYNSVLGLQALYNNKTGSNNVAVGNDTLYYCVECSGNTAIGSECMKGGFVDGMTGKNNTAVGFKSMSGIDDAEGNVAIGYEALKNISGGNFNVAIGQNANSSLTNFSNTIVINASGGAELSAEGSGRLYIKPVRTTSFPNALYYDETTGEITYGPSGGISYWNADMSGIQSALGNVGIGMPSHADYALGVSGHVLLQHLSNVTQSSVLYYNSASNEVTFGGAHWNADVSGIQSASGNVGIGIPSHADYALGVSGRVLFDGLSTATQNNALYYDETSGEITYGLSGGVSYWNADVSGIQSASGNVGIGIPSHADYVLGVSGRVLFDGLSTATQNNALYYDETTGEITYGLSGGVSYWNADVSGIQSASGNVGIGIPSHADYALGVSGRVLFDGLSTATQNNALYYDETTGEITYGLSGGVSYWNADVSGIQSASGNVGIGIPSHADYALGVSGRVLFDGLSTATQNNALYYDETTGEITYGLSGGVSYWNADVSGIQSASGNVGIGIPSHADYALGVSGRVLFDGLSTATQNNALYYDETTGEITYGLSGGVSYWNADVSGIQSASGNVGIGIPSHADYALGVSGRVLFKDLSNVTQSSALYYNSTTYEVTFGGAVVAQENYWGRNDTSFNFWGPSGGTNPAYGSTSGSNNTALGFSALQKLTTGTNNVAVGLGAGRGYTDASGTYTSCTAVGYHALHNNDNSWNTAVGCEALKSNEGGHQNVAVGGRALTLLVDGSRNVAIGDAALFNASGGAGNVAVGYEAASRVTTGNNNLALGYRALADEGSMFAGIEPSGVICLNATGRDFMGGLLPHTDAFYVKPIRAADASASIGPSGVLWYNSASGEICYDITKTFVIPHPEHEGKLLRHACVEAPTRGTNIYEYQINTTKNQQTTKISLPSYFKYINGRPRVYVSATRGFGCGGCGGYVNKEMTEIIVETEKPGTFNIMVTGIRKDAGALAYSSTEYIDEPINGHNLPPSQTFMLRGTSRL